MAMLAPRFGSAAEMYALLPPDAQDLVRRLAQHPAATALWGSRKWRSLWGVANEWHADWEDREEALIANGMPVHIKGASLEDDFLAIHVDIAEDILIRPHAARGFPLHLSIGFKSDWSEGYAEAAVDSINSRWKGVDTVLKISWFGAGGTAFLAADEPLAQDYDVAWFYARGWYSDRGLHISL